MKIRKLEPVYDRMLKGKPSKSWIAFGVLQALLLTILGNFVSFPLWIGIVAVYFVCVYVFFDGLATREEELSKARL